VHLVGAISNLNAKTASLIRRKIIAEKGDANFNLHLYELKNGAPFVITRESGSQTNAKVSGAGALLVKIDVERKNSPPPRLISFGKNNTVSFKGEHCLF